MEPTTHSQQRPIVTAGTVPPEQRLDFLPGTFGAYFIAVERATFDMAHRLIDGHTGGYWEFRTLSNGGGYLVPPVYALPGVATRLRVAVDSNGYAGDMSPDAAGIVVTLFALSHLCWSRRGDPEERVAILVQRYTDLRAYAAEHAERLAIFEAID